MKDKVMEVTTTTLIHNRPSDLMDVMESVAKMYINTGGGGVGGGHWWRNPLPYTYPEG
jgi:hypothetical protein